MAKERILLKLCSTCNITWYYCC